MSDIVLISDEIRILAACIRLYRRAAVGVGTLQI